MLLEGENKARTSLVQPAHKPYASLPTAPAMASDVADGTLIGVESAQSDAARDNEGQQSFYGLVKWLNQPFLLLCRLMRCVGEL
jgi:hypothetical protein